jgi:hypothetical protein
MNYQGIYERLMARAALRQKSGYMERHHVLPKCIGGTDESNNLVLLTPEEHYVAHLLLVKIHPGNHKLLWAVTCMTANSPKTPRTNKLYGWARKRFAILVGQRNKGRKHSKEFSEALSKRMKGVKRGPYKKHSLPSPLKGRPKSAEHRAALAAAALQRPKRGPHSELHRQRQSIRIRQAMRKVDRSYMKTEAYRQLQSERAKAQWALRKAAAEQRVA